MLKEELIQRSPLRILEQSTHGGLGKGNIGVIASRKGVGKTACLVNIAADTLLQGKHIIHVSFSEDTNHILSWYDDIFSELASSFNLDDSSQIYEECCKNRVIMHFAQNGIHVDAIEKSITTLIENSHFIAEIIVIDGYDFGKSSCEDLQEFRNFAQRMQLELWFSATIPDAHGHFNGASIPSLLQPFVNELTIIICLQPREHVIHLNLVKDHDTVMAGDPHLKLDPAQLLIAEEK